MRLRGLLWWALRIGTAIAAAANLAVLAQHPFAEPWVERTAAGARLARIADDFGTVGTHAVPVETIFLLKHVETAKDAARLAGGKTRKTIEVLGLVGAARALVRLSDPAWTALGLLAALAARMLALLSPLCLRPLRPA